MKKPRALILTGYGLNCEQETAYASRRAGAIAHILHINDVIANKKRLNTYQILAIPGGFSFGDDLGGGRAYALRLQNHLNEHIMQFIARDTLTIGICNGFQILTQAHILPGALVANTVPRYYDRWVDVRIYGDSPWLTGIDTLSCPIAHGEGKYSLNATELTTLKKKNLIAARYYMGDLCTYQQLSPNPNGSVDNIAAVTDATGRILGIMPHPERALFFTQLPNWTYLKEQYRRKGKKMPKNGPGLTIFKNAVRYFV